MHVANRGWVCRLRRRWRWGRRLRRAPRALRWWCSSASGAHLYYVCTQHTKAARAMQLRLTCVCLRRALNTPTGQLIVATAFAEDIIALILLSELKACVLCSFFVPGCTCAFSSCADVASRCAGAGQPHGGVAHPPGGRVARIRCALWNMRHLAHAVRALVCNAYCLHTATTLMRYLSCVAGSCCRAGCCHSCRRT